MHKVTLQWPGGEHEFALPIGALRAVQAGCNAGPAQVFQALQMGTWRIEMIEQTLRHGLIGAGMDPLAAKELVVNMLDSRPIGHFVGVAALIMQAAIVGVADDPVGESDGATNSPES